MKGKNKMLTRRFEYSKNGTTSIFTNVHVEYDYGDDHVSIATDNGFYVTLLKNEITIEKHTDNSELYQCADGTRIYIEYVDLV